jgi:hypothetical protein
MGWIERLRSRTWSGSKHPDDAHEHTWSGDTDPSAGHELAHARDLIAERDFVEAEVFARRQIKLDPWSVPARFVLTLELIGQKRAADARAEAQRFTAIAPEDPRGYVASAWVSITVDEIARAEISARRAVELDPGSPDAHYVLATVLERRGAKAEAELELDRAISLEPPQGNSEEAWKRWRAPLVAAITLAAYFAFHALGPLGQRFTNRTVAITLLLVAGVLVVAVLVGLRLQRGRLASLTLTERMTVGLEARRRTAEGTAQLVFPLGLIGIVVAGLALVTMLFATGQKPSLQLTVGDCFSRDQAGSIQQVATIPCQLPHDWEIFAVFVDPRPPGAPYPGLQPLLDSHRPDCAARYAGYVGVPFDRSAPTQMDVLGPEGSYWELDIRTIYCALTAVRRGDQLVGSKRSNVVIASPTE